MRSLWLRFLVYCINKHPDVVMFSVLTAQEAKEMAHNHMATHEWIYEKESKREYVH